MNIFSSLRHGELAGDDPWDGATLEWSLPSPPPPYNFAKIPIVFSRDAWWALKHPERLHVDPIEQTPLAGGPGYATQAAHVSLQETAVAHEPELIHMPAPSFWPFVVALGLLITACSLLTTMALVPVGILVLIGGIYGWSFEPA
jgi:heme/copper-type cytochrome/quinol oxidase subunit 1